MRNRHVIAIALAIQALCASFFIYDILSNIFAIRSTPLAWQMREFIEMSAVFGLLLGFVLGAVALKRSASRQKKAEDQLRLATGAFGALLEEKFAKWGLTPAERDVALFAIKGMSTREIAELRDTAEGTVKAQTNAIYRKAGVAGRPQLISHFVEDLMTGVMEQKLGPPR